MLGEMLKSSLSGFTDALRSNFIKLFTGLEIVIVIVGAVLAIELGIIIYQNHKYNQR